MKKLLLRMLVTIAICTLYACNKGKWPADPNHTLEKIQNSGVIRVGVIDNPPWANYKNQRYQGVEVSLIKKFSTELGATPIWFPFSEAAGVSALKNRQIDLLIGGLTQSSPWKKDIGTVEYFDAKYYIARPHNLPKLPIKNLTVATKNMSFLVPILKKKSAIPIELENPFTYEGEIAAGKWNFDTTQYFLDEKIYQENHIIAFPQGENLLMVTLEKFLKNKKTKINKLLVEETSYENRSKKRI